MANNNSVERAEQRVREMNTVTRRYAEQGSRYMNNMNAAQQTRFETVDVRPEEISPSRPSRPSGTPVQPPRPPSGAGKARQTQREDGSKSVRTVSRNTTDAEKLHKEQPRSVQQDVPRGDGEFDGERLLLLAVIYLLMRENADIKLILALCYLIL